MSNRCTGWYIFIGKPSKDENNVDYVPSVFWRGKTKSPTGTHVSILCHERVCVCCESLGEESNGSTINGQVHLDNANGVISRPSEAL